MHSNKTTNKNQNHRLDQVPHPPKRPSHVPSVQFGNSSGYELPTVQQPLVPSFPSVRNSWDCSPLVPFDPAFKYYEPEIKRHKANHPLPSIYDCEPVTTSRVPSDRPPVQCVDVQFKPGCEYGYNFRIALRVDYAANQPPEVLRELFDGTYRQEEVPLNPPPADPANGGGHQMPPDWPQLAPSTAMQSFLKKCKTPRDAVMAEKAPGEDAFFSSIEHTAAQNDLGGTQLLSLVMLCRMVFHGRAGLKSPVQGVCESLKGHLPHAWPTGFCITALQALSKLKELPGNPSIYAPIAGLIILLDPGAAIGQLATEEPVEADWRMNVPAGPVSVFLNQCESPRRAVEADNAPLAGTFLHCIKRSWQDHPRTGKELALFFLCRMAFNGGASSNLSIQEVCDTLKPYLPNAWPAHFCITAQEARSRLDFLADFKKTNGPIRDLINSLDKRLPE